MVSFSLRFCDENWFWDSSMYTHCSNIWLRRLWKRRLKWPVLSEPFGSTPGNGTLIYIHRILWAWKSSQKLLFMRLLFFRPTVLAVCFVEQRAHGSLCVRIHFRNALVTVNDRVEKYQKRLKLKHITTVTFMTFVVLDTFRERLPRSHVTGMVHKKFYAQGALLAEIYAPLRWGPKR